MSAPHAQPSPTWLVLLIVAALLASSPPAPAEAEALSFPGTMTEDGWVSVRFELHSGSVIAYGQPVGEFRGQHIVRAALYNESGRFMLSSYTMTLSGTAVQVHVEDSFAGTGTEVDRDVVIPHSPSPAGAGATVVGAPGVYRVLLVSAGDASEWRYWFEGDGLVTVLAVDRGNKAFFLLPEDLDGTASVNTNVILAGAHAAFNASRAITVENVLVGEIHQMITVPLSGIAGLDLWHIYVHRSSLETPEHAIDCPCEFEHFTGPDALGPGEYTYRLQVAAAARVIVGHAFFVGADARLA